MNHLRKLFAASLLVVPFIGFGQNFVPNPSFENFHIIPCAFIVSQSGFNSQIVDWTMPTDGTSDLYSANSSPTCFANPTGTGNTMGWRTPRTGNSFAGLFTYGTGGSPNLPNYREYIQVPLTQPLVAGQTYYAEFYCSRAGSTISSNNMGMYFSETFVDSATVRNLNFTPDVVETSIVQVTATWHKVSGQFTATNNAQYLIIGNFMKDNVTSHTTPYVNEAYYFIEDVCVSNNESGCIVCQPNIGTDVVSACSSYTWIDGTTYTSSNHSATHTLTNAGGCDSIVTLHLTIHTPTTGTDVVSACGSYKWLDGITYTSSNHTATHTLTNAVGCDSIVTLDLTIHTPSTGTDVVTACDSYTWIDGNTYTSSNHIATHTLINAAGCDSIVSLDLTLHTASTVADIVTACGSYTWIDGTTYTSSNYMATRTFTNAAGCDSIISLYLTILPTSTGTDIVTTCGSYTWIDGNTYTSSNHTATHTLTNAIGCDSIVTLDLTIQPASTGTDVVMACGSYTWIDGNIYTSSNHTATHTFTNSLGCDSIVTLDLTIRPASTGTNVVTACGSYTWIDGNTYTSSNHTATHTLTNTAGCDSIITLDLTIQPASTGTDVVTACGSYTWIDGNIYTSSNHTATYTITNSTGCDSIVSLDLTIHSASTATDVVTACGSYTWIDGNTYTSSNHTATYTLNNATGCDSIVTLDLTINTIDASVSQNDNHLTADVSNAVYQWLNCEANYAVIPGETDQHFTPNFDGNFAVEITQDGCVDTSACYFVSRAGIIEPNFADLLRIYPNPTDGNFFIDLGVEYESVTVTITNLSGKRVQCDSFDNSQLLNLKLNESAGVYLLQIESREKKAIIRIMKK